MHLAQKLLESKFVNLQTHTPVHSVQSDKTGGFFVDAPRGQVHTRKVIYTNNAYVSGTLPEYAKNIIPCRGICCRIAVADGIMPPLLNDSYINRTPMTILSHTWFLGRMEALLLVALLQNSRHSESSGLIMWMMVV